jgi:hypothetical protein
VFEEVLFYLFFGGGVDWFMELLNLMKTDFPQKNAQRYKILHSIAAEFIDLKSV